MPSQKEISDVRPLVEELMKQSLVAFKAKKISGSEVGDKALELAESASTEAAVFLCMKGAVSYYVRDKAYDKAADVIESIVSKFPDISPEALHEITTSATKNVLANDAERLIEIHKMASKKVANAKKLRTLRVQLKKTPADKDLLRRYAEQTAAAGNWGEALKSFAKLDNDTGKIAQDELAGNAPAVLLADFWWDYKVQEDGAKDAIRQRAAMHYQAAIDSGALEGLRLVLAKNRIAEVAGLNLQTVTEAKPKIEYKFNYKLDNKGNAILLGVEPKPEGTFVCPERVDGHTIKIIDGRPFKNCDKMTRIVLPPKLEKIAAKWVGWGVEGAIFRGCTALASIEISKGNASFTSKNGVLYTKDMKCVIAYPKTRSDIKLDSQTKEVAGGAFISCTFKTVKVPDSIENLWMSAFGYCPNLEVVELPKGFKWCGVYIFEDCPKLTKVVFHGDAPTAYVRKTSTKENIFFQSKKDIVVEVEKGSKGWNGKGSTDLPARWPLSGSDSRPIRYITK